MKNKSNYKLKCCKKIAFIVKKFNWTFVFILNMKNFVHPEMNQQNLFMKSGLKF